MRKSLTLFCTVAAVLALHGDGTFTAETTRFRDSCYKFGETPEAELEGKGYGPGEKIKLAFEVKDPYGRVLRKWSDEMFAEADGSWKRKVSLPGGEYGAFRVYAWANGAALPDSGTRGGGYFTYAVLVDPAHRPDISDEDAFLGIHGGQEGQAPWIGAHWRLDYLTDRWPNGEKKSWDIRNKRMAAEGWKSYFVIFASRIFQRPALYSEEGRKFFKGKLPMIGGQIATEEGAKYCADALRNLARAAIGDEKLAQKQRIYEIFWEPELHYNSTEEIVRAAKIAYAAIKEVDPDGIVVAPTPYTINSYDRFKDYFERGLADYMDGVSMHPYGHVEKDDFRGKIRALRRLVREYKGRELRFYGTESGCGASVEPDSELMQAETWVRTLLTLLGEGFRFHHLFYGFDWGSDSNKVKKGGTGLAYNLDYPKHRWEPVHMSPKPAMASVSAFSLFVDGCRPTCVIDDLGGARTGYAYSNASEDRCVVVLWDCAGRSTVEIETGRETTRIGDLMGNVRDIPSPGGKAKLELSHSAVYVLNADPRLWGREGSLAKALRAKVREVETPLKVKRAAPLFADGRPGLRAEASNEGERELSAKVETRIMGIPEARVARTVRVPPRSSVRVDFTYADCKLNPLKAYRQQVKAAAEDFRAEWVGAVNFLSAPRGTFGKPVAIPGGSVAFSWNENGASVRMVCASEAVEVKFARQALPQRTPNGFADIVNEAVQTLKFSRSGVERVKTYNKGRCRLGAVSSAKFSASPVDSGMEFRVFLPWEELGFKDKPREGDSFRMSAPGIFDTADDNPKSFGLVTLFASGEQPR